jgi:parallel beta-helix repeat protein
MNYTDDPCYNNFTAGQIGRIASITGQYKPNLGGTTLVFPSTYIVGNSTSLKIFHGMTLQFNSGSSITVNGTLNASGTSSSPITFDFISSNSTTQNGIKFNSGSSGTINYCQIRNAYRGIYQNGVSINITNSAVSDCYNGIYLSNSSPTIQYCNIHDNVNAGIYAINSASPYLYNNYMSNNYYGVYCTTNSNPKFGNGSTQGKNGLTNNYCGVYCYNNSYPILGQSSPLNGGYNNLLNAAHNIYNASSGTVYAHHVWWGTTTPANFKIYGSGTTSYTDYLSSSVTISPAPPLSKTGGGLYASAKDEIPMLSELDRAYELVASNNLNEARTVCMNLINNYPDYSVSYNALNLLKETYTNKETTSKNNIYKTLFKEKGNKDLYAIAGLILSDIDKENKLKHIDEVIDKYKGENVIELSLFDKFVYYYFDMEDEKSARAISDELDAQFPKSIGAIEAHKILGDEEYFKMNWEIRPEAETAKQAAEENKFDLGDNYPNPFNPSTTISYSLPTNGNVQIKIFDVLGSEVAKLVDETKSAGKHSVEWNGSNYASGIYFYTITFDNQTLHKKMLMIK